MILKNKKPTHPLEVYTGIKTFKIVQKALLRDSLYGCVNFGKSTLTIDPNQCIEDYKGTLLHEICHIGFDLYGLGDDDYIPQIGNEYITTVTSNMVQQLASLNPELFMFILQNPEEEL